MSNDNHFNSYIIGRSLSYCFGFGKFSLQGTRYYRGLWCDYGTRKISYPKLKERSGFLSSPRCEKDMKL